MGAGKETNEQPDAGSIGSHKSEDGLNNQISEKK